MVDGVWCNIMLRRLANDDYLFLIGSFPPKQLGGFYRSRWCAADGAQQMVHRNGFSRFQEAGL